MTDQPRLPPPARPARSRAIAVGTFDGVHIGHLAVLRQLRDTGIRLAKKSLVITFEPHPLYVVRPEHAPKLLSTVEERTQLLHASGVDEVAVVPFTTSLADYSPREFVERVLRDHFGLYHLVIGYDHGLGKGRTGDAATLQEIGRELGFAVTIVPHTDLNDEPISSSRIRELIERGEVREAALALGRVYALTGRVVPGDGRGKALGFATANLQVDDPNKLLPADGIYAVRVLRAAGEELNGVLHLGKRPTFPGATATVEVHILDFDQQIYGELLTVHFVERIRGVERFETSDALIAAMRDDLRRSRAILQL